MTDSRAAERHLQTPSQTIGPFFGFGLPYPGGAELVSGSNPLAIHLHGTVFDGAGAPVPDALIEIWQADENGTVPSQLGSLDRDSPSSIAAGFTGFGRCPTTRAGDFAFTTIKPGPVDGRAPYVLVTIFARGMTQHLFTRAYFPDEVDRNAADTVLSVVPVDRRSTLIAVEDQPGQYRFDILLQGEGETVFLDFDA